MDLRTTSDQPTSQRSPCPVRRGGVCEYPMGGESLLYDPRSQSIYYLNDVAFAVWQGCDGASLNQLAERVSTSYRVNFDTSLRHVTELVNLFATGGLLIEESANVP